MTPSAEGAQYGVGVTVFGRPRHTIRATTAVSLRPGQGVIGFYGVGRARREEVPGGIEQLREDIKATAQGGSVSITS